MKVKMNELRDVPIHQSQPCRNHKFWILVHNRGTES